jgi:hypothetical protein
MGPMDERSKLRGLLEACHRVIAQLEKIRADPDNPFPDRIRKMCRRMETRLRKLERRPAAGARGSTFSRKSR